MSPAALVQKHFGFSEFRPGQEAVIEALQTEGRALAVFPTGGGKSLCYQLPALLFDGVTVVVSPLISLMKDQIDFLHVHGIPAERLDSTLDAEAIRAIYAQVEDGTLKLLYVAPERFNNERFLEQMARAPIALFAIDEAHCLSEWGHNFRPDYLKLPQIAREIGAERIVALTATATPPVVTDICQAFEISEQAAVITGFYRANLNLCLTPVADSDRLPLLVRRLRSRKPGPTIVYVTLQKTAEFVASRLTQQGLPAEAYHAGLDDQVRVAVQERWMASDTGIIVATIAFGMGIDKADVRYVYHYNLPKSLESYSQEIGRAGRDGRKSTVEMLACRDDLATLENFTYGDTPSEGAVRSLLDELFTLGPEFQVSLYDLTRRHDIRILVLRTVLTYLELAGALRQGTPIYTEYEVQLLRSLPEIAGEFAGTNQQFVRDIFEQAQFGKKWYRLNPETVAAALGVDRGRVLRALTHLEERGWAVIKASGLMQNYTRLRDAEDVEALVGELVARFEQREQQDQERLQHVLNLVAADRCQTNALASYFGETRPTPCGHCTYCVTERASPLPSVLESPQIPSLLDMARWESLRESHLSALGDPRQAARFLCGLSSPALSREKLTRDPLFGALERIRYPDVLAWV